MALYVRNLVVRKLSDILSIDYKSTNLSTKLQSALELVSTTNNKLELHFSTFNIFGRHLSRDIVNEIISAKLENETEHIQAINSIQTDRSTQIIVQLNNELILNSLMDNNLNGQMLLENQQENVIVEFSSPNIAKPFHPGNLRSTMLGNFIANVYKFTNNNTIRWNYLGDWGTQFGYLKVGMDMLKYSPDDMLDDPIMKLFNAYVKAFRLSDSDPKIAATAKNIFREMENETAENLDQWSMCRDITMKELKSTYSRLNVNFDIYDWESNYRKSRISKTVEMLENCNLIETEGDGKKIVKVNMRRIPILKSDGTTLYLLRDIAAIEDRYKKYKFDKILYVVDNGQTDHFLAIKGIGKLLDSKWHNKLEHVKFGRINGMSTRRGNVIFLRDILDEAKEIMTEKQQKSATTKIAINPQLGHETTDILGVSAVIINDLKQKRQRDYDFDWNKALQMNGDTGIKLQYTHCRLHNLIEAFKYLIKDDYLKLINPKYLQEKEAKQLVYEIGRFYEIVYKSKLYLEPCILVNYLFNLCNTTSRALKILNIKNEKSDVIRLNRIVLFAKSRDVLFSGISILGLKPLEQM